MKRKLFIIVAIGLSLNALIWIRLRPNSKAERQTTERTTPSMLENPETLTERITPSMLESPETLAERDRKRLTALNQAVDVADYPYAQEILEAVNSPEFVEFQKQPFSMKRWFDFLESQGVKSYRNMYIDTWDRLFPETALKDHAKVVERLLVEEVLATGLVGTPGSIARELQIMNIYDEKILQSSEQNSAWHNAVFMTHEDPKTWVKWAVKTAENASNIIPPPVDGEKVFNENPVDVPTETRVEDLNPAHVASDGEDTRALEMQTPSLKGRDDVQTELIEQIQPPALESVLQQELESGGLSLQRVNKALQTLKQYGPTEGLRKLKASDPEVATHFERLLRSKEDGTAKIHE